MVGMKTIHLDRGEFIEIITLLLAGEHLFAGTNCLQDRSQELPHHKEVDEGNCKEGRVRSTNPCIESISEASILHSGYLAGYRIVLQRPNVWRTISNYCRTSEEQEGEWKQREHGIIDPLIIVWRFLGQTERKVFVTPVLDQEAKECQRIESRQCWSKEECDKEQIERIGYVGTNIERQPFVRPIELHLCIGSLSSLASGA
mmetsp:Transcript_52500/g.60047  ORF Transcript_52500/g.60047 Transcript_52500/m.60047 type:complete len:201 (-) Transcript_52500:2072-2674(-)